MIEDGYWKSELGNHIRKLKKWTFLCRFGDNYTEHQVNKYLLYSTVVIRKIIEDEVNAKKDYEKWQEKISNQKYSEEKDQNDFLMPRFLLLDYKISAIKYPFKGDSDFLPHRVVPHYYSDGNSHEEINGWHACNQIIHNYIWDLAFEKESKKLLGFLVSSDRYKDEALYLIPIEEWLKFISFCKNNCSINEH